MLVVETIAKIRRAHFVQGKPIKQICRELKLSRKVVRKVLRSEQTAFEYKRSVQPQPKLGAWREELDRLLASNSARSSRERVTLLRIYEDLRGLGYEGGYDAVRRYAAAWRREGSTGTAAAFVPLSFDPGEAYQFDWSHEIVLIDGVTVTVKVAHMRLCYSRMPFVRAYSLSGFSDIHCWQPRLICSKNGLSSPLTAIARVFLLWARPAPAPSASTAVAAARMIFRFKSVTPFG